MSELFKEIANYLLLVKPGDALHSTRTLAARHQMSIGSISACLTHLEQTGAVTLIRRGRLGTFLEAKSSAKLWKYVSEGPMVIALTIPSFIKCEGLATAIYSLLNNAGIETYLIFVRGSYNRFKALRTGLCKAIVVSALSADELKTEAEQELLCLPPKTFVTEHRVVHRRKEREGQSSLIVGIDFDSFDIKHLTELEFADAHVEYIQVPYTQTDLNFGKSAIDAVVSDADHVRHLDTRDFVSRPLSPHVRTLVGDRDSSAALLIQKQDTATAIVLREYLHIPDLLDIQEKVVAGLMISRY